MRAICDIDRRFEIIEFLVKSGADVNFATKEGYTPLHYNIDLSGSTGTGDLPFRIAQLLKDHGADTEKRNHYGWTPLMRAALEGSCDEFKALLNIGAKFDVEYPSYSMPAFTRRKSLARVSMASPQKILLLLDAGFLPTRSLINEVKADLATVKDPASDYARSLEESLRLISRQTGE